MKIDPELKLILKAILTCAYVSNSNKKEWHDSMIEQGELLSQKFFKRNKIK